MIRLEKIFLAPPIDTLVEIGIITSGTTCLGLESFRDQHPTIVEGDCLIYFIPSLGNKRPLLCSGPVATSLWCPTGFFIWREGKEFATEVTASPERDWGILSKDFSLLESGHDDPY
jgi:hypothetical protein